MSKVKILDSLTANQIAAGEVVERPVSVVKELVENAIDAGSTRIKINLIQGGLKQIKISDNGYGMTYEDLNIAIKRHATSKIEKVEDLDKLITLGFRGEALPSIAAVSKMSIASRFFESTEGYEIEIVDGEVIKGFEIGCPVGTVVRVDDLFYNTPARKKFLKSSSTELGHITDMIGRLAMSRPEIAFELANDGRSLLSTPGNGELAQAIFSVYGRNVVGNMIEVSSGEDEFFGFISVPQMTRSSRHYYNFYINGRLVKSSEIANIIEEVYYTRVPAKRYPIIVLHFKLPADFFDVNVHPTKLEVKFRDGLPIKDLLSKTLNMALSKSTDVIPTISQNKAPETAQDNTPDKMYVVKQERVLLKESKNESKNDLSSLFQENTVFHVAHEKVDNDRSLEYEEKQKISIFSSLRPMGQLDGTFIIANGASGLYVIDQHAAHERVRYEKVKKLYQEQASATSYLAIPLTIELTNQQALWVVDNIVSLSDIGFVLEHFGANTFLLRGIPHWNIDGNSEELLLLIVEKIGREGKEFNITDAIEEQIHSIACKSSVKANRYLTDADINYLLKELDECENPYTCPHGRPVMISLTVSEIRKRFLRNE